MKTLILLTIIYSTLAFTDQMMSLDQIAKIDVKKLDCSKSDTELVQLKHQMSLWSDLLSHQKSIVHDIKVLSRVEGMLQHKKHESFLELQQKSTKSKVSKLLHTLQLPHLKSKIGQSQMKLLLQKCDELEGESYDEARKELCRLLKEYVANLKNCKQECHQAPITVVKIKGNIKQIDVVREQCGNGSGNTVHVITDEKTITIDHKGNKHETLHKKE